MHVFIIVPFVRVVCGTVLRHLFASVSTGRRRMVGTVGRTLPRRIQAIAVAAAAAGASGAPTVARFIVAVAVAVTDGEQIIEST
jgi:hypothetical protein